MAATWADRRADGIAEQWVTKRKLGVKGTEKLDSELCSKLLTDGVRLRSARLRFQRPTAMRCRLNSREENSQFGRFFKKKKRKPNYDNGEGTEKDAGTKKSARIFGALH